VFAPYALRHDPGTLELVGLVLVVLVLAGLSKRYVEDATRFWPWLTKSPRATLSASAAAMLVIALVSGTQLYAADAKEQQTASLLADVSGRPCFGAPAMENRARCTEALTALPLVAVTKKDAPWAPQSGCRGAGSDPAVLKCYWGTGRPSRVVALIGDSHAEHWRGALHRIAKAKNWQVIEMFAGGCPPTYARSVIFERRSRDGNECRDWTTKATARLKALAPDDIITTAYVQQNVFAPADSGPKGFEQVWRQWRAFSRVTVLRDNPTTDNRNGPQCLAVNAGKPQACANPRSKVLIDDDMMRAARGMPTEVNLVDLSDYFCDAKTCYAVIGGASVYYDYDHLSMQFSGTLAAPLLRALPKT
jgi:hypothetical protein